jgi:SAM-dependent methyltransferase
VDYDKGLLARLNPRHVLAKAEMEIRKALAPISMERTPLQSGTFELWGDRYPYFIHPYNLTWRNERAVEVSVATRFISGMDGEGLEFGNVVGHYVPIRWRVVDKFELGTGVVNVDIVDYAPEERFDWIVSISTLEHVGWDENPRDSGKAVRAFHHLRSLLNPDGRMLLTTPMGHNEGLDRAILDGLPVERQATIVRVGGRWRATDKLEWRPYGDGVHGARSVWIAVVASGE